jgi:hypothetical protein
MEASVDLGDPCRAAIDRQPPWRRRRGDNGPRARIAVLALVFAWLAPAALDAEGTEPPSPRLTVQGGLSHEALSPDDPVQFWLTAYNGSGTAVSNVRLVDVFPRLVEVRRVAATCGETADGPRARRERALLLDPPLDLARAGTVARSLDIGHAATACVDAVARRVEDATLVAVVAWDTGDGVESRATVTLGRLRVQGRGSRLFWSLYEHAAIPLLIPVTLLIGGLVGGHYAQRWLEEQVRVRETWTLMLPKSHEHTMKHYMGIISTADSLAEEMVALKRQRPSLEQAIAAGVAPETVAKENRGIERTLQEAFFRFMLLERQLRHLRDEVGGVYFKNRLGEEIVAHCISGYQQHSPYRWAARTEPRWPASELLSLALDGMRPFESRAEFWSRVPAVHGEPSPVDQVHAAGHPIPHPRAVRAAKDFLCQVFDRWSREPDAATAVGYLRVASAVMAHEGNRPLRYWYGSREPLSLSDESRADLEALTLKDKTLEAWMADYERAERAGSREDGRDDGEPPS